MKSEVRTGAGQVLGAVEFELVGLDEPTSTTVFRLPLSFGVLQPESGDVGRVVVEVDAIGTSSTGVQQTLFTRRAVTGFLEGKSLLLPMFLSSRCRTLQCGAGQTCTQSGCVSDAVDETQLQESTGTGADLVIVVGDVTDGGDEIPDTGLVAEDAGVRLDADAPMDATADASAPDSGIVDDVGVRFLDAGSVFVQTSPVRMDWVYSDPASLYFNQSEVTVAQYQACVIAGGCSTNNYEGITAPFQICNYGDVSRLDHPMNCVNYSGAVEFCDWAGSRLPTQDEWYAEASNLRRRIYPWGDSPEASCSHVTMNDNLQVDPQRRGCGMMTTAPVCSKRLGNSLSGLCDMSGNVWEWTNSQRPLENDSTVFWVKRGGCWKCDAQSNLAATGNSATQDSLQDTFGFRCVSETQPGATPSRDGGIKRDAATADSGIVDDVGVRFLDAGSVFVQTSPVRMDWVYSDPASLYFNQSEVTVAQYQACVMAGGCSTNNYDATDSDCNYDKGTRTDHPINCVNWHGAVEYCTWAGARLPTEEEWYAEASNNDSRLYPWGDSPHAGCDYCIMNDRNSAANGCGEDSTGSVCSKRIGDSVSGLCDMSGNVWEWTSTRYGDFRVIHGGSWLTGTLPSHLQPRRARRLHTRHVTAVNNGFRCVRDTPPGTTPSQDAAVTMDASTTPDSGVTVDSGIAPDTGVSPDSGVAADASPPDGGGLFLDAGSVFVQTSSVTLNWVYSTPAALYFNQSEVTVAQYEACVTSGACTSGNHLTSTTQYCNSGNGSRSDHPMNCVNWYGATEFCTWVGARLPTESQWYAEASNNGTRTYPWGNTPAADCSRAVMYQGGNGCGNHSTGPACSKPLGNSVSGLCDMAGNLWEWSASAGGSSGSRTTCGGSWWGTHSMATSSRNPNQPTYQGSNHGFRCVRDTPP